MNEQLLTVATKDLAQNSLAELLQVAAFYKVKTSNINKFLVTLARTIYKNHVRRVTMPPATNYASLDELHAARDRGEISPAEFQQLQLAFLFPEEETEEEEQLAAEAADCVNPTDDITKELWTRAPPIKIKFLDPDPNKKPYILCLTRSTLKYYLKDRATRMAIWIQNPAANPMDTEGYGGQPDKSLPVQQIKGVANMYVLNPDILLNGGNFTGIPIATKIRIGNIKGSFGIGEIHGQTPGYTLYYLMDEATPMDMNMIKTAWAEYINCILANQTNCEISLIQKYPSMATEKIKNDLLIKTTITKRLDEQTKIDTIKILLDAGADINTQNRYGSTALTLAAKKGYLKIAELLIKAGANVNIQDRHGETALILAVLTKKGLKIAELLIKAGANVNIQGRHGETALLFAVLTKNIEIVELLIKAGADLNVQDRQGETALIEAVLNRNINIVELLIEAGANVNIKNNSGGTALDYAKDRKLIALLQSKRKLNPYQ